MKKLSIKWILENIDDNEAWSQQFQQQGDMQATVPTGNSKDLYDFMNEIVEQLEETKLFVSQLMMNERINEQRKLELLANKLNGEIEVLRGQESGIRFLLSKGRK